MADAIASSGPLLPHEHRVCVERNGSRASPFGSAVLKQNVTSSPGRRYSKDPPIVFAKEMLSVASMTRRHQNEVVGCEVRPTDNGTEALCEKHLETLSTSYTNAAAVAGNTVGIGKVIDEGYPLQSAQVIVGKLNDAKASPTPPAAGHQHANAGTARFCVGQTVQFRDRGEDWQTGTVCSSCPLRVKPEGWVAGFQWDEVQEKAEKGAASNFVASTLLFAPGSGVAANNSAARASGSQTVFSKSQRGPLSAGCASLTGRPTRAASPVGTTPIHWSPPSGPPRAASPSGMSAITWPSPVGAASRSVSPVRLVDASMRAGSPPGTPSTLLAPHCGASAGAGVRMAPTSWSSPRRAPTGSQARSRSPDEAAQFIQIQSSGVPSIRSISPAPWRLTSEVSRGTALPAGVALTYSPTGVVRGRASSPLGTVSSPLRARPLSPLGTVSPPLRARPSIASARVASPTGSLYPRSFATNILSPSGSTDTQPISQSPRSLKWGTAPDSTDGVVGQVAPGCNATSSRSYGALQKSEADASGVGSHSIGAVDGGDISSINDSDVTQPSRCGSPVRRRVTPTCATPRPRRVDRVLQHQQVSFLHTTSDSTSYNRSDSPAKSGSLLPVRRTVVPQPMDVTSRQISFKYVDERDKDAKSSSAPLDTESMQVSFRYSDDAPRAEVPASGAALPVNAGSPSTARRVTSPQPAATVGSFIASRTTSTSPVRISSGSIMSAGRPVGSISPARQHRGSTSVLRAASPAVILRTTRHTEGATPRIPFVLQLSAHEPALRGHPLPCTGLVVGGHSSPAKKTDKHPQRSDSELTYYHI